MARCADPRVGVCLDFGHANLSRAPLEEWFAQLGPRIGYLHLSDNGGAFDVHSALGTGTVDWAPASRLAAALPAPPLITLEQAAMAEPNRRNAENGYPTLEMGIGLNTGEMIVGNIGSTKRTKYGVTGSEVNLCGRIESYTVGGQVLISPTTRAQIKAPLGVVAERTVLPKGVTRPLTLAQVNALGAPYNVAYLPGCEPPRPLAAPLPVEFLTMEEKHVGAVALQGTLTALSRDAALMTTAAPLRPYQNLQLLIGDKLLVKVTEVNGTTAALRFTARPAVFDAWLNGQRDL